jgi:hypothetical protein
MKGKNQPTLVCTWFCKNGSKDGVSGQFSHVSIVLEWHETVEKWT